MTPGNANHARVVWQLAVAAVSSLVQSAPAVAHAQTVTETSGLADAHKLPLHPARVVRFSTTEGTWISLDVSPDGKTIVFDLLGDLYTVPITGGNASRMTAGMAVNRQPRYSPDGQHLVFVSDRGGSENVWIAERDGRRARQLSNLDGYDGDGAVASPAWSPDGRTIVVSQRVGATRLGDDPWNGRWLLASYDVETGLMRWVSDTTPDHVRSALGPTFGRDRRTVYASVEGSFRPVAWRDLANWQVARVDLLTGRIEAEMGWDVGRMGMRPVVSPNGRFLVYATSSGSRVGLRLRDLRTDRERWLVRGVLDPPPSSARPDSRDLVPGYVVTPDGKALLIAYGGKIHRIELATGRTRVIPFVADVARGLGPLTVFQFTLPDTAVQTRSVMQPALSPDGRRVAFIALDRIWVMDLPHDSHSAGVPRRITVDTMSEFYPSWSPNGEWIYYSTWVDGDGGAVRRVRVIHDNLARPSRSERLTSDTALYFQTAVSPDGERVVAIRASLSPDRVLRPKVDFRPFDLALVWLPVGGGQSRTVASLVGVRSRNLYPVDQVYFTADPSQIYVGLKSWRWDGTEAGTAVTVTSRDPTAALGNIVEAAGALSPDKRRAVVSRRYSLIELTLPHPPPGKSDTLDLDRALTAPFGGPTGAARRWGTALAPWVSWSHDGRRVLFNQGGSLFVGDVREAAWTSFSRVEVALRVPVDVPRGTVVLRGARLITMRDREVIERGDVVVRDNRIIAVGRVGQVAIPRKARVLNLSGMTILPGYVDVHDHLALAKGVHPQQWWESLLRFVFGVTTVRDPEPGQDNDVFAYQERERTGDLLAPRMFSTGIAYYGTDPPIKTLEDARDRVRPNAEEFCSETFKIYYDRATDRRARELLAMATAEKRLNATAHINGIDNALVGVIDGLSGIEHQVPTRLYDDMATLIAHSGTTHTQTYGSQLYGSFNFMSRRHGLPWQWAQVRRFAPPSALALTCSAGCTGDQPAYGPLELANLLPPLTSAARIVARRGRVAIGAHGNMPGLGFHYEMWLHALGGMPNRDILRSATIVGATAIGHAKDFGSLEPGKLADLQILNKNPLADIHNTTSIRYVMKNGRLYQAEDLTEIWPRHKPLPSIYLWDTTSSSGTTPQDRN